MNKSEIEYRNKIAKYTNCLPEDIFFYWKGRVALFALLKAMGIGQGDEVIVQGYTCVVVSNAVLYLKATPIYVDINRDTYNMNIDVLEDKINEKTKAIICQNTYGLSSNLERIEELADFYSKQYGHRIYTIEDCTHGFGGTYNGKANGSSCDASFFSTQWSKPYTTGVGGFAVVHNSEIKEHLTDLEKEKVDPSLLEKIELKLMYFVRKYIITDITYWPMVRLYRWLSRKNIVVGSSSGEETNGVEMPEAFFKNQSMVQIRKGIKALKKLDSVNHLRKHNAKRYTELLEKMGKIHVSWELFDNHIFIRYPLLVENREEFRNKAERSKIALGEWFESPIYPAQGSLEIWGVNTEELPVSMEICSQMVNLPTDEKNVQKVLKFLVENEEYIL